eukprot:8104070-Pyramimonas_sp.AAC.1
MGQRAETCGPTRRARGGGKRIGPTGAADRGGGERRKWQPAPALAELNRADAGGKAALSCS